MKIETPGAPDIVTGEVVIRLPQTLHEHIIVEQAKLNGLIEEYKAGGRSKYVSRESFRIAIDSQLAKVKRLHKKLERSYG